MYSGFHFDPSRLPLSKEEWEPRQAEWLPTPADQQYLLSVIGAQVIAPYELSLWLEQKVLRRVTGMNPGGTIDLLGLSVTMNAAVHSSSLVEDGRTVYLGVASGYVVRFENRLTIYFAGDTSVF